MNTEKKLMLAGQKDSFWLIKALLLGIIMGGVSFGLSRLISQLPVLQDIQRDIWLLVFLLCVPLLTGSGMVFLGKYPYRKMFWKGFLAGLLGGVAVSLAYAMRENIAQNRPDLLYFTTDGMAVLGVIAIGVGLLTGWFASLLGKSRKIEAELKPLLPKNNADLPPEVLSKKGFTDITLPVTRSYMLPYTCVLCGAEPAPYMLKVLGKNNRDVAAFEFPLCERCDASRKYRFRYRWALILIAIPTLFSLLIPVITTNLYTFAYAFIGIVCMFVFNAITVPAAVIRRMTIMMFAVVIKNYNPPGFLGALSGKSGTIRFRFKNKTFAEKFRALNLSTAKLSAAEI